MVPILLDFSEELTTERLFLRKPQPGDGRMVYESVCRSRDALKAHAAWAHEEPDPEIQEKWNRESMANFILRKSLRYLIFEKVSGHYAGCISLFDIDWELPHMEVGYWTDTRFAGKGYMTEALKRVTAFALEELGAVRIELYAATINPASRRVAEKAGYEYEGTLKKADRLPDDKTYRDYALYAKTRSE